MLHPVRPRPRSGFVLLEMEIVIAIIAIIAAIAIPNLLEARKGANESSAIGTLRAVNNAQALFFQRDIDGNDVHDYADTLEVLHDHDLIDDVVASGEKSGYTFRMVRGAADAWWARAEPVEPCVSGERYFYVDQTGVIRASTCGEAGPESTPINGGDHADDEGCTCRRAQSAQVLARWAVVGLERLGGEGILTRAARRLETTQLTDAVLAAMDTDKSGGVDLEEALAADALAIAAKLADDPQGTDLGARVEERARGILRTLRSMQVRKLRPGLASETSPPQLPLGQHAGKAASAFLLSIDLHDPKGPPFRGK